MSAAILVPGGHLQTRVAQLADGSLVPAVVVVDSTGAAAGASTGAGGPLGAGQATPATALSGAWQHVDLSMPDLTAYAVDGVANMQIGVLSGTITGTPPSTLQVFLSSNGLPLTDVSASFAPVASDSVQGFAFLVNARCPITVANGIRVHFKSSTATGTLASLAVALGA